MLAVLVLSLVPPGPALPTTGWDKTNHLLAFGVLALLGCRGYPRNVAMLLGCLLACHAVEKAVQRLSAACSMVRGQAASIG